MFSFLILSLVSEIIELGPVYVGIKQGMPIVLIMTMTVFYQIGNLMMDFVPLKNSLLFTIGLIVCGLTYLNIKDWNYLAFAFQIMLSSFYVQAVRGFYKAECPAWLKRCFRISGFVASPLILIGNGQWAILFTVCLARRSLIIGVFSDSFVSSEPIQKTKILSFVMIFHQMHYFVYTYIMPIYVFKITNSYLVSAFVFAITWIVYLSPQTIAEKYSNINFKAMFFICHSFLALCLGLMSLSAYYNITYAVLGLWLLTGLGGGSVFCIRHLSDKYLEINMNLSENIGHVLGPVVAMLICTAVPEKELVFLLPISCLFVIVAIIS